MKRLLGVFTVFWGQAGRLILQFATILFLARLLGPSQFGAYVAVLGVMSILAPYSDLGFAPLLVRYAATSPELTGKWIGRALQALMVAGPIVVLCLVVVQRTAFRSIPPHLFVSVAASEILGGRARSIAAFAFTANQEFRSLSLLYVLTGALRLVAVCLLAAIGPSLGNWATLNAVYGVAIGAMATIWFVRTYGVRWPPFASLRPYVREAIAFSLGASTENANANLDKSMLAALAPTAAAGIYAVSYRFITAVWVPFNAAMTYLFPRYFRQEALRAGGAQRLAQRVSPYAIAFGVTSTGILWLVAPVIPRLFGEQYLDSVQVLRWLAFVPLIQAIYWPFGDALTGAGLQHVRARIQIASLVVNVLANAALIPTWSWTGAAISTLTSESIVLFAFLFLSHRQTRLVRHGRNKADFGQEKKE